MVFLPFLSAGHSRRCHLLITRCYLSQMNHITFLNKLQPVICDFFLATFKTGKKPSDKGSICFSLNKKLYRAGPLAD